MTKLLDLAAQYRSGAITARVFVEAVWEPKDITRLAKEVCIGRDEYIICIAGNVVRGASWIKVWAAAADYTLARIEEIENYKYSLSLQKLLLSNHENAEWRNPHDWEADKEALQRTVNLLQAHLDSLCKGIREDVLNG